MTTNRDLSKTQKIIVWLLQLIAIVILFQTLFFKFTAAPESVYIFKTIGMEPWGRIGTGIVELIACLLMIWPKRAWLGALLGLGTISGAIFFHLTTLGIEVQGDGGTLFFLALTVFSCCIVILFIRKNQMMEELKTLFDSKTI